MSGSMRFSEMLHEYLELRDAENAPEQRGTIASRAEDGRRMVALLEQMDELIHGIPEQR